MSTHNNLHADFEHKQCYTHIKVTEGTGDYKWNDGAGGAGGYCKGKGTNCKSYPCQTNYSGIITVLPDGWSLTSSISSANLFIKDDLGNWNLYERDDNNYPFNPSESVIIDNCNDIPELVGVSVNLDGIVTDDNGNYTVFIPISVLILETKVCGVGQCAPLRL